MSENDSLLHGVKTSSSAKPGHPKHQTATRIATQTPPFSLLGPFYLEFPQLVRPESLYAPRKELPTTLPHEILHALRGESDIAHALRAQLLCRWEL